MENSQKKVAKTIRMTKEVEEKFENAFKESNTDSKGEYLDSILDIVLNDEPTVEIEEVEIEVEKRLEPNQILITLTQAQMFVLREHVTRSQEFATEQNRIIDKLKNKPWYASSDLYKPEFQELWVRNIELSEKMDEAEKENAIKYNMSAFLLNLFLTNIIEGNISNTEVSVDDIELFIQNQDETSKIEENEPVNN